jgi:hypothetical protein
MAVGGIALDAIGSAFVEQFGTGLYRAGGLLTSLVGLIALCSSHGMDRASQPGGPSRAERRGPEHSAEVRRDGTLSSRGPRSPTAQGVRQLATPDSR